MTDDRQPLDENEIDELNQLLFDYAEQVHTAHDSKREEGVDCVFSISELDGFLTALATGPESLSPSVWLPALWDGFMPEFQSREEAEVLTGLLLRHADELSRVLFEAPEEFQPIYEQDDDGNVLAEEWCYGYMRAVELRRKDWQALMDSQPELLAAQMILSGAYVSPDEEEAEQPSEQELIELRDDVLPESIFAVRDFWVAEAEKPKAPQAGRNDPCPCGSGKKYKQCCLQ